MTAYSRFLLYAIAHVKHLPPDLGRVFRLGTRRAGAWFLIA